MRQGPLLLLLVLLPGAALADEVYLKGAGRVSGQIVEQTETLVTVNVGDGTISVPMSGVDHIVKVRSPLDEFDARASQVAPKDVNEWRGLAQWAADQGLGRQSRQAFQKVLELAPDDPSAREALGFVRLDGRWVTEEESYRAQGYVKFEGEWMTPGEAQAAQAAVDAEFARREEERRANQAEALQREAEDRARDAEKQAQEEQESYSDYPVYWGGWGYGVTYWPSTPVKNRPVNRPNRPAQLPSRGGHR